MLLAAISMGFLGSFHCLGMCGPIAILASGKPNQITSKLLYNGGRVITYTLLGAIMGLLANFVNFSLYQDVLSIVLGATLVVVVLFVSSSQLLHLPAPSFLTSFLTRLKIALGKHIKNGTKVSSLTTGILNGFLPCGLVYMALLAAIASGGMREGALFMLLFGLGTIPMLLVVAMGGATIRKYVGLNLNKLVPAFIVVMGVLLILRGLNLDIPYVSPDLSGFSKKPSITNCIDDI